MTAQFRPVHRDMPMLLPPDLRDWVPEDDFVHFVIQAVEQMPFSANAFDVNHRGTGSKQYQPRMMLALLVYCYAMGIFSSRRVERATYRDVAVLNAGMALVAAGAAEPARPSTRAGGRVGIFRSNGFKARPSNFAPVARQRGNKAFAELLCQLKADKNHQGSCAGPTHWNHSKLRPRQDHAAGLGRAAA